VRRGGHSVAAAGLLLWTFKFCSAPSAGSTRVGAPTRPSYWARAALPSFPRRLGRKCRADITPGEPALGAVVVGRMHRLRRIEGADCQGNVVSCVIGQRQRRSARAAVRANCYGRRAEADRFPCPLHGAAREPGQGREGRAGPSPAHRAMAKVDGFGGGPAGPSHRAAETSTLKHELAPSRGGRTTTPRSERTALMSDRSDAGSGAPIQPRYR
jgi:hypothetical protein